MRPAVAPGFEPRRAGDDTTIHHLKFTSIEELGLTWQGNPRTGASCVGSTTPRSPMDPMEEDAVEAIDGDDDEEEKKPKKNARLLPSPRPRPSRLGQALGPDADRLDRDQRRLQAGRHLRLQPERGRRGPGRRADRQGQGQRTSSRRPRSRCPTTLPVWAPRSLGPLLWPNLSRRNSPTRPIEDEEEVDDDEDDDEEAEDDDDED